MGMSTSARASGLAIAAAYKNTSTGKAKTLPQRIVIIGQGATSKVYASTRTRIYGADEAANNWGFGTPIRHVAKVLFPVFGSGVGDIPVFVHALQPAAGSTGSTGTILAVKTTVTETLTYYAVIGDFRSLPVVWTPDMTALQFHAAMTTAINAIPDMPATAADNAAAGVGLTSKWKGTTANAISLAIEGPAGKGVTFTLTAFAGGAGDPSAADVTAALALCGNNRDTLVINCLGDATGVLAVISTWGESRWDPLVRRPVAGVIYGSVETDVTAAIATPDARKSDRTNVKLVVPASPTLPWVIAADAARVVATVANDNPATGYTANQLTSVTPGPDSVQWDFTKRDAAFKGGVSTVTVEDGEVRMCDTITFYHPVGEEPPGFRKVVTLQKYANAIYVIDLIFSQKEWAESPLIPDGEATTNPKAKTPSMAKADVCAAMVALGLAAILVDVKATTKSVRAWIDEQNGDRLNLIAPMKVSGNTNQKSVDLLFSFYLGTAPAA